MGAARHQVEQVVVPTLEEIENLAARASDGDLDALGALFEHYCSRVYRFVYSKVPNVAEAEDIASAVWERVAGEIRHYSSRRIGGFPGWLFTITRRIIIDTGRRAQRHPTVPLPDMLAIGQIRRAANEREDHDTTSDIVITADAILVALGNLTRRERRCLLWRHYMGMNIEETAVLMSSSPGAIKVLEYRAKQKVASQIPKPGDTFLPTKVVAMGSGGEVVPYRPAQRR